jgi:hypothetical protein
MRGARWPRTHQDLYLGLNTWRAIRNLTSRHLAYVPMTSIPFHLSGWSSPCSFLNPALDRGFQLWYDIRLWWQLRDDLLLATLLLGRCGFYSHCWGVSCLVINLLVKSSHTTREFTRVVLLWHIRWKYYTGNYLWRIHYWRKITPLFLIMNTPTEDTRVFYDRAFIVFWLGKTICQKFQVVRQSYRGKELSFRIYWLLLLLLSSSTIIGFTLSI